MDSAPPNSAQDQLQEKPLPPPLAPRQEPPRGQALFQYVVECLDKGCDPADISAQLVRFGYAAKDADAIVKDSAEWRQRNAGLTLSSGTGSKDGGGINANMAIGAIVCLIGIAVTVVTFMTASHSGGRYVVAWGAIVFGAIQFLRGAAQAGQEKRSAEAPADEKPADSRKARL